MARGWALARLLRRALEPAAGPAWQAERQPRHPEVAVVSLGREFGHDKLRAAITTAVSLGACDVAAVRYLLTEAGLHKGQAYAVDVGELARYDRPRPTMAEYDVLLSAPCVGTA